MTKCKHFIMISSALSKTKHKKVNCSYGTYLLDNKNCLGLL